MLPPPEIGPIWRTPCPRSNLTARLSRPLLVLALFGGLSAAATLALWSYYGTAVFLEIVRTGWAACF